MTVLRRMTNVLSDDKQQQVLALGRLGWTLRRIEAGDGRAARDGQRVSEGGRASPVRRDAAAGRAVWPAAKTGQAEVSTDSGGTGQLTA